MTWSETGNIAYRVGLQAFEPDALLASPCRAACASRVERVCDARLASFLYVLRLRTYDI